MTYEQFITLETAKLAKQAGFDWEVYSCYYKSSPDRVSTNGTLTSNFNGYAFQHIAISAPTQSVLQKWLRETHHLHITIFSSSQESWMFRITKPHQKLEDGMYGEDFPTYETALEAGLQKGLTLLIENQ